eukprot:RCo011894
MAMRFNPKLSLVCASRQSALPFASASPPPYPKQQVYTTPAPPPAMHLRETDVGGVALPVSFDLFMFLFSLPPFCFPSGWSSASGHPHLLPFAKPNSLCTYLLCPREVPRGKAGSQCLFVTTATATAFPFSTSEYPSAPQWSRGAGKVLWSDDLLPLEESSTFASPPPPPLTPFGFYFFGLWCVWLVFSPTFVSP